jgi:type I restriction-modification system DNA methylase subunit
MSLFQKSVEKKYLNELDQNLIDVKYTDFQNYFGNPERQENIRNAKEEQFQEGFLRELFVKILGYTINPEPNFNITTELKSIDSSQKADGAVLKGEDAIAVIELKSTNTTDLDTIETQAFGYKNHHPNCIYVITSNFEKLRFYIQNAVDHIDFDLFNLTKEQFSLLWLCLAKDNLLNDVPLKIKDSSVLQEENITKKLYADYSKFRSELFENIKKNNPEKDKLLVFKKVQKLLDRFLFIFFAEDRQLLPPNSISMIIDQWKQQTDWGDDVHLYNRYKKYFHLLNTGWQGKKYEIFAYNGGLFAPDEVLDNLIIDDEVLDDNTLTLSAYNFNPEQIDEGENVVDVNILGHIFEHSLGEIENVQAEIKGEKIDAQKTKRKKDGIFYTPKYITKYIVENTVGRLCEEKRKELKLIDEEYAKGRRNRKKETIRSLDKKLDDYRNWLLSLTILDPACGSGAFLNQALEFLITEHRKIDELRFQLFGGSIVFTDITSNILEKNIFGVDVNEESVEIAKLSLWLRTAQKGRKLDTLSNNIKCGNSLIDDPEVAGGKAFNWQKEFPAIFAKGGFDVVIGNPPYVTGTLLDETKNYFKRYFSTAQYQLDLYILFIERSLDLISEKGLVSFITPNSWLKNLMMSDCRKLLLDKTQIMTLIPNIPNVFEGVNVDSLIFSLTKDKKKTDKIEIWTLHNNILRFKHIVNQFDFSKNDKFIFTVEINSELKLIIDKLKKGITTMDNIFEITRGVNPYDVYTGQAKSIITSKAYHANYKKDESFVPELRGKHVERYFYKWDGIHYISYGDWLAAPRNPKYFKGERILFREILGDNFVCTYINEDFIVDRSLYIALHTNDNFNCKYVLGLLASKLLAFYFRFVNNEFDALFPKIRLAEFKKLPIKNSENSKQQVIVNAVDRMNTIKSDYNKLVSNFQNLLKSKFDINKVSKKLQRWHEFEFNDILKELKKTKTQLSLSEEAEWMQYFSEQKEKAQTIKSEIDKTDKEIDWMVYELYGLTEDEIAIIERTVK